MKKRAFQKIVFNVKPNEELEEGEIVSDNEGDHINDPRPLRSAKKRIVTYDGPESRQELSKEEELDPTPEEKMQYESLRRGLVRQRLGYNLKRDPAPTSRSGSRDEEDADDKSGFMSNIAQLKADLSELLFNEPYQTMAVSTVSSAYRCFFKRALPVDNGYTTEDLLFSLNLFSLKWEGERRVVKWDQGKFLANFKDNAEDLLQAKERIPLDQFLPLYLKVFGHNIREGAFPEMCGYPCTSELLTACCPSIWVPEFDHQMLQMYNAVDFSGYSSVNYEYEGRKICTFFRSGWCKFGQLCFNIH